MTIGIGGIKKYHKTIANINSIQALEEVYLVYLRKHKGDMRKAVKAYKGTVKNYTSYNRVMKVYKRLKNENRRNL